jgi:hypothetical protein
MNRTSLVRVPLAFAAAGIAVAVARGGAAAPAAPALPATHKAFFAAHCLECHGDAATESAVRLDDIPFTIDSIEAAERWQKVLGVLNSGEMPPPDRPRPPDAARLELLADLSRGLAAARKSLGDAGRIATLRRLNRREYRHTILDLFDLDPDVAALPDDKSGGSFDTFGSGLFMSSDQFEQYLAIGRRVAAAAVDRWRRSAGPAPPRRTERTEVEILARRRMGGLLNGYFLGGYRKAKEWQAAGADPARARDFGFPDEHEAKFRIHAYEQHGPYLGQYLALPKSDEGAWLTYVAGNYHHTEAITIPADAPTGRYLLRLRLGGNDKAPVLRRFLEMGIAEADDFRRLGVFQVVGTIHQPRTIELPVTISADGPRTFSFREKRHADAAAASFANGVARATNGVGLDPAVWIDWVEWDGPVPDEGDAARWTRLFGGPPPADAAADPRPILEAVARRAFRGVAPEPGYLDRLVAIHAGQAAAGRPFPDSLVEPVATILASPAFLYIHEPGTVPPAAAETDRSLSDVELAARLSYFLWSAPPDDELLAAARAGALRDPEQLTRQTSRLLADPRSFVFARGFTHQWLDLDRLDFFRFDHQLHPDFDEATRESAKGEIHHTFHRLLRDDLDARKLLASDFVVVDGLLAAYYGLEDLADPAKPRPIAGDEFRRVQLPAGSPRGGLLGMAAVLGMGSNGERTSPVERGAWVLRKLLDAPPPPAPPNVPQLSRLDAKPVSTRERLALHQEQPQCAQCHRTIDPIGFGLENFDAAGRWRTEEHAYRTDWVVKGGPVGKVVKASFPIEPAGAFHRGPAFRDYFELRQRIAERGDDFLRGLVTALYAYALGRPASFADGEAIDALVAGARADGGRLGSLVRRLVATPEFGTK